LPIVAPEVGRRPQRHQAAEVLGGADAAEVVVAAEASGVAQVDQAAQSAQLRAHGVEVVQGGDVTAGPAAEEGVREPPDQPGADQPLLDGFPEHGASLPTGEGTRAARSGVRRPTIRTLPQPAQLRKQQAGFAARGLGEGRGLFSMCR